MESLAGGSATRYGLYEEGEGQTRRASVDSWYHLRRPGSVFSIFRKYSFQDGFFVLHPLQLDEHVGKEDEHRVNREELQEDAKRGHGLEEIKRMTYGPIWAGSDQASGFGHQTKGTSQVGQSEN